MRKIYPINCGDKVLASTCSTPVTEEQYNELVNKVNEAECCTALTQAALDAYKCEQLSAIGTNNITAQAGNISNLASNTGNICNINTKCVKVNNKVCITCTGNITGVCSLNACNITASKVSATCHTGQCVEACDVYFELSNTECANVTRLTATNVNATTATATNANICNTTTKNLTVQCNLNICCGSINVNTVNATNNNTTNSNITNLTTCNTSANVANIKYQTHTNTPQHITEPGDIWIVLPKFTNGIYYLEAENDGAKKLFSIEVDNSQANIRFKWSNNERLYTIDADFIDDTDGVQFIQIHVKTYGEEITLYSHSTSLDNIAPPNIYASKQYEGAVSWDFQDYAGTYTPIEFIEYLYANHVNIYNTAFNHVCVAYDIGIPSGFDEFGKPTGYCTGNVCDYLTPVDKNNIRTLEWRAPATCVCQCDLGLLSADALYHYDGVARDCNGCVQYPISELADNSCVHGTLFAADCVDVPKLRTTNITDDEDTLVLTDPIRSTDECPYIPTGTLCNNKPVQYNATDDVLETTESINIECGTFDKLTANKAYICELHAVTEIQENTTSDYLTLRANNNTSLTANEYSGVLINNYNGSCEAGIVTDCTGTVRVGHGAKTDTTYANLYYHNNKYYTDAAYTTQVTPSGVLTGWTERDEDSDGNVHYTNAVFSVVDWSKAEPLLTRSEATNMTANALTCWNATCKCAATIAAPTCNEQILCACIVNGNLTYCWADKKADTFIFNTMAEYTTYAASHNVPDGSHIVIRCETDYVFGDNK